MAVFPHSSCICTMYKLQQIALVNEQAILISAKYKCKCTKEINLSSSEQFDYFQKFFLKKEKKKWKLDLNCHRHMVQRLVLSILRCSF